MANRRPAIIAPDGALVFSLSESADIMTSYTSPPIRIATRTGKRIIKFTLDARDNLTVTEIDLAGNMVGAGVIVNLVNVPQGYDYVFKVPDISPSANAVPGTLGQVTRSRVSSGEPFVFGNRHTGVSRKIAETERYISSRWIDRLIFVGIFLCLSSVMIAVLASGPHPLELVQRFGLGPVNFLMFIAGWLLMVVMLLLHRSAKGGRW